jgi:NADH-quinone oxidoreductase subunit M
MRAYFLLFTGARHVSSVSLVIGPRERIAVLTLAVLILAGGLFPQPGVSSRERAAEAILQERRFGQPGIDQAARAEKSKAKSTRRAFSLSTSTPRPAIVIAPFQH